MVTWSSGWDTICATPGMETHDCCAVYMLKTIEVTSGEGCDCIVRLDPELKCVFKKILMDDMGRTQGLKSMKRMAVTDCGLDTIPGELGDLSALTRLDLNENEFSSQDTCSWWSSTLSR
jgi:hypothetical protein